MEDIEHINTIANSTRKGFKMITLEKLAGYEPLDERLAADFRVSPSGEVRPESRALVEKVEIPEVLPKTRRGRTAFIAGTDGVAITNDTNGIFAVMDKNEKLKIKNNVLKNIAKSKDARNAHLQAQVNNAEKKYTAAANELKQLQGEHQALQSKHQAVLNELGTVKGDYSRALQQLQEANNKADEAARKAETYKARLNKTIEYGKTLREDLSKAKKGLYGLGALAAASLAGNIYQANKN